MVDYIVSRIEAIFNIVISAGTGNLVLSPETFNASIYNGVLVIMKNAVMPVAYVLLGLLFMFELYNVTVRTESPQGTLGVEIPFRVMFKMVVCKTVIDSTELILGAVYGISTEIIGNIGTTISGGNTLTPADIEVIRALIEDMEFGVKLMTAVEVTLIYLIVKFVMVIVSVIVVGRMVELYVLMSVAPIPFATFPNAEMSGVGKNYLKAFAAVCLQGVLIYIVVAMFPLLFGNATMGDISDPNNFSESLMTAAGYAFVLLISIFATGRWAKSICNAM